MNTLIDWLGKTDDLNISYDAGLRTGSLLLAEDNNAQLPVLAYKETDDIREITEEQWDKSINKADRIDYLIAISCGAIAGLIDVFYVGEFSLEKANEWGSKETNKFVQKIAELNGFKGDDLQDAIRFLEDNYGIPADSAINDFGGGLQHHLRDFSHHFSIGGLVCSLFTQFTGKVIGTDSNGALKIVEVSDKTLIGKNFEEKILYGIVNWFFHMVSDMAGSHEKAGKGTGIPGPIVSLIKEISTIPFLKDKKIDDVEFHTWVSKLFNGTLLAKRDENGKILEPVKFDLRTEIGILHEIGKQFVPVIINECLVRGSFFVRRLFIAIKDAKIESISDLEKINTSGILPFNNRIIRRMITVSSGTFTAVDSVDAAVRAAIVNRAINPKFFVDFAVRINIVGVGRFVVACKADGQFITEDIRNAKEKRNKIEQEYERLIADLKSLSLSLEQMQVLYSLERIIIYDDISNTKKEENIAIKKKWAKEWEKRLLESVNVPISNLEDFFLDEKSIISNLNEGDVTSWQYLVIMESILFKPYSPLFGDDKDKEFKGLRFRSDYLEKVFPDKTDFITEKDIDRFSKEYKKSSSTLTGRTTNLLIGAVGTTVVMAASGGLAFAFAPAIATALVGEAAAGLSGAALVSYSLAAIGGGSLAAGGLGMAGGTAIITGGGALVGMIGGTGISVATTVNLLSQASYVLEECCKLLTFSKTVLKDRFEDTETISNIQSIVGGRISELEQNIETFSEKSDTDSEEEKKTKKTKTKVAQKSIKYLKKLNGELNKLLK